MYVFQVYDSHCTKLVKCKEYNTIGRTRKFCGLSIYAKGYKILGLFISIEKICLSIKYQIRPVNLCRSASYSVNQILIIYGTLHYL